MDIGSFNVSNFNPINRLQVGYAPGAVTGTTGETSASLINADLSGRQGYQEDYSVRDAAAGLWKREYMSFNLNDPDSIERWCETQKERLQNGISTLDPTEEELTAYIDALRENGLDGTVDWSGLGREFGAFKSASPEELSDALDYLASRYVSALDKLERSFSDDELAAQRAKLEEVYQAGKTGMIEGYTQFLRSGLGLSASDAQAVRDSLSTLLDERVEAYRGALETVYDSLSGPDGVWLRNHDAYIASRLRAAGTPGQSKAAYSVQDLTAAGRIARSYRTEIENAGRNEAKLALNLAMADMQAEEMIGRGLVSDNMATLLRNSRAQGHRNALDALDQYLARREGSRLPGEPKGTFAPVDSGVFQGVYNAVMGAYKQSGGDVAGAIRAGASYGRTATAQAAARNPNALRWDIGMEYYWKDFYTAPDVSERTALDRQMDALFTPLGRTAGRSGCSAYQQYVNRWQEFLDSIGCGLDVRG